VLIYLDLDSSEPGFGKSNLPPLPTAEGAEQSDDSKRKKKRRRQGPVSAIVSTKLKTEEELLEFNSAQMEEYLKEVSATMNLTASELKELKKIRRSIKNREYAQSSRDKKKQFIEELEKKLTESNSENAALQQRLTILEQENQKLKVQLAKIGNAIKKDPEIMERLKVIAVGNTPKPATPVNTKQSFFKLSSSSKRMATAFSATLFIVLFSFGLMVNFRPRSSIDSSPIVCGTRYNMDPQGILTL
jgi:hypothetical protein